MIAIYHTITRHCYNNYIDSVVYSNAFFGQGEGPIYLDNVQCFGNETNLLDCSSNGAPTCSHADDAGIQCIPTCKKGDYIMDPSYVLYHYSIHFCWCKFLEAS